MPHPLYETPAGTSPRWLITNWNDDPTLILFQKWGGARSHKLLDQVAQWTGSGWSTKRWVPKTPTVPAAVLQHVMGELVRREVVK